MAANGCDSVVTLHLTVNHSAHNVETVAECGSYTWNGTVYYTSTTQIRGYTNNDGCPSADTLHLTIYPVYSVTESREVAPTDLPYEWNGVVFTAAGTQSATLPTVHGCDSVVAMTLTVTGVTGDSPFMTVQQVSADTAVLTAFANASGRTEKVSINYRLYKNNVLVTDVDYDCGGRFFIGTDFQNRPVGSELSAAEGNIPGNTFHYANNYYEYFYWGFLDGRANTVTHSFTNEGTYKLVFELVNEEGGQDFSLSYGGDYTQKIGGKSSHPLAGVLATAEVTFEVTASTGGGDEPPATQVTGPTLRLSSETANGVVPDTLYVSSNGYDSEKIAIRYTVYAGNEPLNMLTNVGTIRVNTGYNNTEYGANLADPAGFIPQATFHPSSRYYNFFYAAFQNTTYNTITASWTVPGEYRIQFELVKMTGGSNLPLTYGTDRSPLGGRNATFADVVFDTKTLVYDANSTAHNQSTGIADGGAAAADGVGLYPNPANDRAVLTVPRVSEGAYLVVTDVNGREVLRTRVTDVRTEFSVAGWSQGVYFVTLHDVTQSVTKKLVVTK